MKIYWKRKVEIIDKKQVAKQFDFIVVKNIYIYISTCMKIYTRVIKNDLWVMETWGLGFGFLVFLVIFMFLILHVIHTLLL